MKWFRFYSEVMHDPKVQMLRPELFKFWVNILCLASEQDERGTIPSADQIAFVLRLKKSTVERFLEELQTSLLLHCSSSEASVKDHCSFTGPLVIHNWEGRQPRSDNVAERVKTHRQKTSVKKFAQNGAFSVDTCNVTVTSQIKRGEGELDSELIPPPSSREDDEQATTEAIVSGPPVVDPPPALPEPVHAPNLRSPEDLAEVNAAIALLAGYPNTEWLAQRIGQEHNTPTQIRLQGWKWRVAAHKAFELSEPLNSPRQWPYFLGIVKNARRAELEKIQADSSEANGDGGPQPARAPPPRKPTAAELARNAQTEMIRRITSSFTEEDENHGRT